MDVTKYDETRERVRDLVWRYLHDNRHLEPTVDDIMVVFDERGVNWWCGPTEFYMMLDEADEKEKTTTP